MKIVKFIYFLSCAESAASNITVTFPYKTGKDSVLSIIRIFYPEDYDVTLETRFSFSINNIALLRLEKAIKTEDSKIKFLASFISLIFFIDEQNLADAAKENSCHRRSQP